MVGVGAWGVYPPEDMAGALGYIDSATPLSPDRQDPPVHLHSAGEVPEQSGSPEQPRVNQRLRMVQTLPRLGTNP